MNANNSIVKHNYEMEEEMKTNLPCSLVETKNELLAQASTKINEVTVTNSEDIHFGNRHYINGNITIQQYLPENIANGGIQNKHYLKSEIENLGQRFFGNSVIKPNIKDENNISQWNKRSLIILFGIVFACLLGLLTLILAFTLGNNFGNSNPDMTDQIKNENTAFESAKLRLVRRVAWLAQPPEGSLDKIKLPTKNVIISHTATSPCFSQPECSVTVRNIQMFHIEGNHWNDIGYNFLVGSDGVAYEGRGWEYQGAHTLGWNSVSMGISFIGTYTQNQKPPVDAQVSAVQKLIDVGVSLGKISTNYSLYTHNQFIVNTESPGIHVINIVSKWPHYSKQPPEAS